jgi:hypothetical protein
MGSIYNVVIDHMLLSIIEFFNLLLEVSAKFPYKSRDISAAIVWYAIK